MCMYVHTFFPFFCGLLIGISPSILTFRSLPLSAARRHPPPPKNVPLFLSRMPHLFFLPWTPYCRCSLFIFLHLTVYSCVLLSLSLSLLLLLKQDLNFPVSSLCSFSSHSSFLPSLHFFSLLCTCNVSVLF